MDDAEATATPETPDEVVSVADAPDAAPPTDAAPESADVLEPTAELDAAPPAEPAIDPAIEPTAEVDAAPPAEPAIEPAGEPEPEPVRLDTDALAEQMTRPDEDARRDALARLADVAIPAAGLGRIEDVAGWLAAVQGACPTQPIEHARVVLFAGDHGVAAEHVSAYALDATAAQVRSVVDGGGAVNVLARLHGATVRVVDVSVGKPSGRVDVEDACSRADAEAAFILGTEIADAEVDAGADLLIPSLIGVGHSTVAAVLTGVLTGKDAAAVTGRGSGVDDAAWMRKCEAVRDAMRRGRPVLADQMHLLAKVGGRDFAAACGFLVQAAIRRTPVLLDGVGITTCALLVQRIAFRAPQWWLAGSASSEPAHTAALDRMSLEPLLADYSIRHGEGVGALLALPLVKSAAALLAELQTFEEAGIPAPVLRSRI